MDNWEEIGPILEKLITSGFELRPWNPKYGGCFTMSNYTDEGLPCQGWDTPEICEVGNTIIEVVTKINKIVSNKKPLANESTKG